MKKFIKLVLFGFISLCMTMGLIEWHMAHITKPRIFTDTKQLKEHEVAMVLGTSKYVKSGGQNLYFKFRMQAAQNLYQSSKVQYFLVSGDNGTRYYDETTAMQQDLMKRGVPKDKIALDFAGFRTLDSVVRAQKVFGQDKFIIVSQKFHLQRALYIAYHHGIDAVGYQAKGVGIKLRRRAAVMVFLRERLARVKMVLDLITGKGPRFLGPKVDVKTQDRDVNLRKENSAKDKKN